MPRLQPPDQPLGQAAGPFRCQIKHSREQMCVKQFMQLSQAGKRVVAQVSDGKTQASKKVIIKPGAESSALIEIGLIGSIHKQAETRKEKYLGWASVLEKSEAQVKKKFWCVFQKHLFLSTIKKQLGSLGQFTAERSDAAQGSGEPTTLSPVPLHGNGFWGHLHSAASHILQNTV